MAIIVFLISNTAISQTIVFQENFENSTLNFTSSSTGASSSWVLNTRIQSQGLKSDSAAVVLTDTLRLTSNSFSTIGNSNVYLEFDHICKIEFNDNALVEVSNDGGTTWTKLTSVEYTGTGQFGTIGNKFSVASYVTDWLPGTNSAVPQNSWWKHEGFNISALIGATANAKIRFSLYDGNTNGANGNAGWFIDDIKVTASFSELTPPTISFYNPIVPDTIYSITPTKIIAQINDLSGVDTAYLFYQVNTSNWDSILMTKSLPDTFYANIAFPGFGRNINYYVKAKDSSPAKNIGISITKSYFCKYSTGGTSTIGTGTSSSTLYTLYASYQDMRTQHLYTAAEILAGGIPGGGNITSLAFNITTASSTTFNNFTISVKNTTASSISTLDTSGLTVVYSANFIPSTTGWNIFNFTTPFAWDGVSNLLINYCFDNTATGTSASLQYTSASGKFVYKTSSVAGISGCSLIGGSATTYRLNVKLTTSPPPPLSTDAGFGQLVNPSGSIQASTSTNIIAKIKNFGTDTLTSATVNWSIDGVSQTPFNWTGQLLKDSLSANITLGSLNVPVGNHILKIWTTNPNGQSDMNWGNDEFTLNFYACSNLFTGSYTIAPTGGDFTSISNAIIALNQCGIAGPVIFNIAPGTYTDQVTIPYILGSSATNTVTFQSANGDSTGVILQYTPTGASDNYVINFNGASYVKIKGMTIKSLDATYARAIQFTGTDSNITLQSNIFEGTSTVNTDLNQVIMMVNTNYVANLYIIANKFNNGRVGLNYVGTPAGSNIVIKYNTFNNQLARPVYLNRIVNLEFAYNTLFSDATRSTNGGFFITNLTGLWKIYNNSFINLAGARVWEGWVNSGIGVGQEALVYNNYLYGGSPTASYIFDGGGTYVHVKFLNNTFVGNPTNVLVNFNNYYGCNNYVTFKNNILSSTSKLLHVTPSATSGSPICSSNFANYSFDYNDYNTTNATFATFNGTTCGSLLALQTATSQESHSVSINPNFVAPQDPHFTNFALKALGTFVPEVTFDIDGQTRSTTNPDMGCDEYILFNNDAGIPSMAQSSLCPGTNNIEVKLKNFGSNVLSSAIINWSINGSVQTPFSYSGALASLGDTNIIVGTYNLINTSTYTLKFWTSSPNSTTDGNVQNDTLLISNFHTSLSGTYTVGGATADFLTPTDAITAINTYGICGPTILNLNPGTYNGRLTIGNFVGSSAINTLTIKSLNNDTSAIITDLATSTSDNWIVKLNGAKYVTLQSLTFAPQNTTSYGNCVVVTNASKYNTIKGNLFQGIANGTTTDLALYRSEDAQSIRNDVIGNRFTKGSVSILMKGSSTSLRLDSVYIYKNKLENYQQYGIRVEYSNAPIIDSNIVISNISHTGVRPGIHVYYCYDNYRITRNTIISSVTTYPVGIYFDNCTSTNSTWGVAANNYIILTGGTNNSYGMRIYPANYLKVAYNSILVNGTSTTDTRGINGATGSNIHIISNNVVSNNYPSFYEGSCVTYSDFNNFYSTSSRYAYYTTAYQNFSSQAALSLASQKDSNSVSFDPYFASNTDLHILNGALNGIAKPLSEVTVDIDNEPRNITTPDIGADEFTPSPYDLNALEIVNPDFTNCGMTNQQSITLRIKNTGSASVNGGFSASYKIGSATPITENINDTILPGLYKDYTFTSKANLSTGTFTTDQIFNIKAWVYLSTDQIHVNDTTTKTVVSGYTPVAPTSTLAYIANYATTPIITATSSDTLVWYNSNTSSTVLYTGKWFTSPQLYDTTIFYAGAKSMQGLNCVGPRTPVTVNIINFPNIDAGITAITDPITNIPSKTMHALKVDLKNYGMTTLTSSKIIYSLNGTIVDTLNWTGSLAHGASTNAEVDSLYLAGGIYTLKVWSSLPNNTLDAFNNNDTATFVFNACMQGTYTIGQTSTVTYDFPTFNAAKTALVTAGICGNVTFLVDTGYYEERITWTAIPGSGPNAQVTFQSMNGDSTSVTLHYTLSSAAAWAMKFNGVSYINFNKMKLSVLGSNTWGRIMEISNGTNHLSFQNCILEGMPGANTTTNYTTIFISVGTNSYNTFKNNKILHGAYGIYLNGASSTSWDKGNIIEGNDISGFYYYGIYASYQDSIQIIGNKIYDTGVAAYTRYGLNAQYCNNAYKIIGNKINLAGTTTYGLRDYYGNYYSYNTNPSGYGLIANNMINVSGTTNYGLYAYYSNGSEYYFNTIKVSNSSTAYGVYQYNTASNSVGQKFKNNIFVNSGTGYGVYFGTTAQISESDYNNYYNPNSNIAYWGGAKSDLASLQSASGKDLHSMNISAPFISNSDLHLLSTNLSAKGVFIPKVVTDIDGELRGQLPTIGADEVPLKPIDGGVSIVIEPASTTFEYDTIYPKIIICNYGTDTLFNVPISYNVNNGSPVLYTYYDTLAQYQCDTVVLPYFIGPAGNSTLCAKTQIQGDSNFFNDETCKNFFGTPSKDAVASRIIKLAEGCGLTTDSVKLVIKNIGGLVVNGGITAYYQVNNSPTIISQVVTDSIPLNDSIILKFNTPINLAVTTTDMIFDVKAWIVYIGDNVNYNDTTNTSTKSFHTPPSPIVSNISIPYGTSTILSAFSSTNDSIIWYDSLFYGTKLYEGANYTTPILFATDTFYAESMSGGSGGIATLGTSTTSTTTMCVTPYSSYYEGARSQYLIRASELSALGISSGKISSVTFKVTSAGNYVMNNFDIKLAQTTESSISGAYITPVSGFTSVYSNPSEPAASVGPKTFVFTTPLIWDGSSNLLFDICHDNDINNTCSGCYGTSGGVEYSITPFNSVYGRYADNVQSCGTSSTNSLASTYYTYRPNMVLNILPNGCVSNRTPLVVTVGSPSAIDAGVTSVTAPVSSIYMSSQETVKVKIRNYGSTALSNFSVSYKVDALTTVTETVAGPIASQDSLIYTFIAKADFGIIGNSYNVKAWVHPAGDATALNDTINTIINHFVPSYCTSAATSTTYYDIANVTFGGINNTSPTPYSALYTDYTSTSSASVAPGNTYPISISIQTTATSSTVGYCKVFIDYNRDGIYTAADETAFASSFAAGGQIITGTINVPLNAINGFSQMRVVAVYNGTASSVVPCGTYTYGETEDYSIVIAPRIAMDAGVEYIFEPKTISNNSVTPLNLQIRNFGYDTIPSVAVSYILNNGTPNTITYSTAINPGDSALVTFGNISLQQGQNNICAYTTLTGDSNTFNNQKCATSYLQAVATIPYFDNFEGNDLWFPDTVSNQWQRGIPQMTNINTAYSPVNVWGTNLTGDYANNSNDMLYTPKFVIPNNIDSFYIKFWQKLNTQAANDGGYIEYKTNTTGFWVALGYLGDAAGTNWYTNNVNGTHMWTGSLGWQQASYSLNLSTMPADTIQFRFIFKSNASTNNYSGWAIDNFEISLASIPKNAGVISINSPLNAVQMGSTVNVKANIKNFGTTALTSIPVSYKINGSSAINEVFTPSGSGLLPDSVAEYSFNTSFTAPFSKFNICVKTSVTGDTYNFNDEFCDSINILPTNLDASVIKVEVNPVFGLDTTKNSFDTKTTITIVNKGLNQLTSIPVEYKVGSITMATETWTGTLNSLDTTTYTFVQTYKSPIGIYSLKASSKLIGDANASNDEYSRNYIGVLDIGGINDLNSKDFTVNQNIPNPANGNTKINYFIPTQGMVSFELRNSLGQAIIYNETSAPAGDNSIEFDANNLANGVYYFILKYNNKTITRKMMVSK